MSESNNCGAMREQLALMLYGELNFDAEERVEAHLEGCADCRQALERQRALHEVVDGVGLVPSPALLARNRQELSAAIDIETGVEKRGERGGAGAGSWWRQLTGGWKFAGLGPVGTPVGAMALLAVGFFAAKFTPGWNPGGGYQGMDLANIGGAQVRNVAAQPDGTVRIVLDETRQRMVAGSLDDQNIRVLLLQASKDGADAGLRAQSVTILTGNAGEEDIRQALLAALANDQSPDVRMKAMEGLQQFAGDPRVQMAMAHALAKDSNTGIRTRAIDALTARPGVDLSRQAVGMLQEMMDREDDVYVREQAERMLRSIKASAEIY